MRTLFQCLALAILLRGNAIGVAIPLDRLPPGGGWHPGVPGGIDTGRTQYCSVKVSIPGTGATAKGDGVTDDSGLINFALAGCPANAYVDLGEGNFFVGTTGIQFPAHASRITLRGRGMFKTRVFSPNAQQIVESRAPFGNSQWQVLTSNTSAGETNLVLANATVFQPGDYALLEKNNDPTELTYGATQVSSVRAQSEIVKITSKSGNTVGLDRAVYVGYPTSRGSMLSRFADLDGLEAMPYRCGIEDMEIDRTAAGGLNNVHFFAAKECWIKGVWFSKPFHWCLKAEFSARCEVRECVFTGFWNGGGDTSYGTGLYSMATDNLVENNAFVNMRHALICEYGGMGNVFGYNYSFNPLNENGLSTDYLMEDQDSHGNAWFNLWEGNIAAKFALDNSLGGSSFNTAFRCLVQRRGLASTYVSCFGADIQRANLNANLVGVVFGTPPVPTPLYRFGSTGDDQSNLDSNVTNTIYIHGVVDRVASTTTWASTNADHVLPASYYLAARPAFFTGGYVWPPIGPDVAGVTNTIPAVALYATWLAGSVATTNIQIGVTGRVVLTGGVNLKVGP